MEILSCKHQTQTSIHATNQECMDFSHSSLIWVLLFMPVIMSVISRKVRIGSTLMMQRWPLLLSPPSGKDTFTYSLKSEANLKEIHTNDQ
jgi:hypothetical protein